LILKKILFLCIAFFTLLNASKPEITVNILPQKYFVEKIVKDKFEINVMVKYRLLYMLFGLSFILQAQLLDNTQLKYALYAAAACCTIGALVPLESDFTALKTIGLIAGVIITIFNRKRNS
jgi:hypothetical protein